MTQSRSIVFLSWTDRAACKGKLYLFYPDFSERPVKKMRREMLAKAICAKCPVAQQCKQYAHSNPEYGIWGGENEEERFCQDVPVPAGTRADYKRRKMLRKSLLQQKEELNV